MFSKRLSSFGVFLILAAVGSVLLVAQSPQPVGSCPMAGYSSAALDVNNVAPTLSITAPADGALYPLGTPVALTAAITDPGADTFTCSINWDDPASPALETSSSTTKNCNKSPRRQVSTR